jgi:hypothetical protein
MPTNNDIFFMKVSMPQERSNQATHHYLLTMMYAKDAIDSKSPEHATVNALALVLILKTSEAKQNWPVTCQTRIDV